MRGDALGTDTVEKAVQAVGMVIPPVRVDLLTDQGKLLVLRGICLKALKSGEGRTWQLAEIDRLAPDIHRFPGCELNQWDSSLMLLMGKGIASNTKI